MTLYRKRSKKNLNFSPLIIFMKKAKVKINGYVREEVWKRFLEVVFKEHGKTSGGALSTSIEKALESYIKEEN